MVPQLVNIWFQVLFHSPPGVLFTFPSQYYALSVTKGYLALRGGPAYSVKVPRVSTYSGFRHANRPFTYGAFTLSGRPSQAVLLSLLDQFRGPNPGVHALRFGLFRFRSPLLPESHVVFSSSGYLDVSVHRVPLLTLWIGVRIPEVCSGGFPHSEISGS